MNLSDMSLEELKQLTDDLCEAVDKLFEPIEIVEAEQKSTEISDT